MDNASLDQMMGEIDSDGNGKVSLQEFTTWYSLKYKEPEPQKVQESCKCGNVFKEDSKFCRKCGTKR